MIEMEVTGKYDFNFSFQFFLIFFFLKNKQAKYNVFNRDSREHVILLRR